MNEISIILKAINKIDILSSPTEYTREILKVICDNLEYNFGSIIEIDNHGNGNMVSSYNLPRNYLEMVNNVEKPLLSSPSGEAFETGNVVVVNDPLSDPRLVPWHDIIHFFKLKTIIWVPLKSKGQVFGTYVLYDTKTRRVSLIEIRILKQIALIISNTVISNHYLDELNQKTKELQYEITERKKIEHHLKESEERFRTIAEQSLLGIVIIQDDRIAYVNKMMSQINEFSIEEMLNWTPMEFLKVIHPENKEGITENVKQHQARDLDLKCFNSSKIITASGKIKWVDIYSKSIIYQGKFADFALIADVTERMEAEQKLKETEEKWDSLTENSKDIILILDKNDIIQYINNTIHPLTPEEVIGTSIYEYVSKEHYDAIRKSLKKVYTTGNTESYEIPLDMLKINTQIDTLWFNTKAVPIKTDKEVSAVILIATEITERKKIEQKIKESEEKYRKAYNRADFYKDLFAHDMSNYLQVILSNIELTSILLKNKKKLNIAEENIFKIKQNVIKGANLISKVKLLSKLEESQIFFQLIDILAILQNVIKFLQNYFVDKEVKVEIDSPYDKIVVQTCEMINEVFENILINAVHHNINPITEILIIISEIEKDGKGFYKFEFIDNGIGVPDNVKEKIFQRGFMEDQSKKGMGIGLSLVKRIIDSTKGQIWVEDKIERHRSKGSNFILLFPRID